jgi:hypothetical protein
MAFTKVSTAYKNTVCPIDKTIHEEDGIYPAGAHHPDHPDMVRVLKPGHASRISRCIATPMAEKTEDFWFIDIGCHSTSFRSAYCRFRGSIYAFTNHRDTYLVKIRNPNIEIRNKFELPKFK